MANYPTSLPSGSPADHAAVLAEQIAIATELGLVPKGRYADIKSRLQVPRRLSDYAVADARSFNDGNITTGTNIFTSATATFTAADVGKSIIYGTQVTTPGRTTIAGFTNSTTVTLTANATATVAACGFTYGTDASAGLQSAIDAMSTAGGGELYIDGYFFIYAGGVSKDLSATRQSPLLFTGSAGASRFYFGCANNVDAIYFLNCEQITFRNVTFLGTLQVKDDCQKMLAFDEVYLATLDNCGFYGIIGNTSTTAAVVDANKTGLRVVGCEFRGAASGNATNQSVVCNRNWRRVLIEDTTFIDFGNLDGFNYSKTGINGGLGWIGVYTPQGAATYGSVNDQSPVVISGCTFDEGNFRGINIDAGSGNRIEKVVIENCSTNVLGIASGTGLTATRINKLTVRDSWYGYNTGTINTATINLSDITVCKLERVSCMQNANTIAATSTVLRLLVEECEYTTLTTSAPQCLVTYGGVVNMAKSTFGDLTQRLAADHAISATTATEVTGLKAAALGVGAYLAEYYLLVQSATATVSPMYGLNFTGTATMNAWMDYADASTDLLALVNKAGATNTTALGFAGRQGATAFSTTAPNMGHVGGVGTINVNIMVRVTAMLNVTVAGDLAFWHGSETATSTTVKAGSVLRLTKIQ